VRYRVKNISFDAVPVTGIPGIRLLDPNGGTQDPAEMSSSEPGLAAGGLAPGAEVSRMVVFKVAKDRFNAATWLLLVGGAHGPRVTLQ
jgi:hypothetical protein